MRYESEPGDSGEEYSPGGIIGDGNPTLAWLDPVERIFTSEDMRRLREAGNSERNEGEVP